MNIQFLNISKNVPYSGIHKMNQPVIYNMFNIRRPTIKLQQESRIEIKKDILEPEKKRMIWGPAIWFLFHTLAEKIKEESFSYIRVELLNIIYAICVNLPCPYCSVHAKEYLDKINFNAIQTKNDLKNILFHFHNTVNKNKNFTLFQRDQLDEKYSKGNTINIIQNFMYHFKDKNRNPKLIANDLQRSRIAANLNNWFIQNIKYFNL